MKASVLFHLWPTLHRDILRFLDLVPEGGLDASIPGLGLGLVDQFRHVAEVEEYWLRVIQEHDAPLREKASDPSPDVASLRAALTGAFAATERMLDESAVDTLLAQAVTSSYPAKNALEALALSHLHTVHHRAEIAALLRTLGVDPCDWV